MNDDETKRLIATLIQVVDRANARITAMEQLIEAEAMAGLTARLLDEQDERFNEAMASLKERLDRHHNRIHALALHVDDHNNTYVAGLELRLTAIEQRLAALEAQGDPDDVRDLDELSNGATAGTVWDDETTGTPGAKSDLHVLIRTMGAKAQAELIDKLGLVVDDVTRDSLHALDELDKLNAYWAGRAMDARLPLRKLNNFPPTEGNE